MADPVDDGLDNQPRLDSLECVQYDPETQTLLDNMGIQLSKCTVEAIFYSCIDHMEHSDLELRALGRMSVEKNCPRMVDQFNFDYFV